MDARVKCAVMDHNENTQRKQATVRKAQQIRERLGSNVLSQSRQRKDWNAKPILEEKTYKFVEDITIQLVQSKKRVINEKT